MRVVCVIFVLLLASMTSAQCQKTAYSGKVDFPELFKYNDQKNTNLETALQSISSSFNEQEVTVTQELLAAIMATLVKEVEVHAFLPKEEQWDYGMGTGCSRPNGCKNDGIGHYQGGVDYKGRGYIQLTLKSNYEKYCPDCVGTSTPELDVCGCKNQEYCTVTDTAICPQVKALQPERTAIIFASYYIKSPTGKDLVSLSNSKHYWDVGKLINGGDAYASGFGIKANEYLTLFDNNPDKTEKLLTWLNSGTSTSTPVAVDVLSLGIPQPGSTPNDAIAWKEKGEALYNQYNFDEALQAYEEAIRLDPNDAESWSSKCAALNNLGRYNEGLQASDKAIELNPDLAEAWSNKAWSLYGLGRYEEDLQASDKAIGLNPDLAEAWGNKGAALCVLERYEESLQASDKAIELNPDLDSAWNNKGTALYELDRYEESLQALDRAIKLNPDNATPWVSKWLALKKLGRTTEADAAFKKAKDLGYRNDWMFW
jgi:tetratricopeptide (TPR) repeat protein